MSEAKQFLEVLPPRTRVEKVNSQPGDLVPDGTLGTIVTRVGPFTENGEIRLGYVVTWDKFPGLGIAIAHFRVRCPACPS